MGNIGIGAHILYQLTNMIHIALHFIVPLLVAITLYRYSIYANGVAANFSIVQNLPRIRFT